ncbi:unnamed protein product [Closterium sp. NIES-65]|nr:unnamed protein product [Closterium sp. NIES-65]
MPSLIPFPPCSSRVPIPPTRLIPGWAGNSCIPLWPFDYVYSYIASSSASFVDAYADPYSTSFGRYIPHIFMPVIRRHQFLKGNQVRCCAAHRQPGAVQCGSQATRQWFILQRRHAEAVVGDTLHYAKHNLSCAVSPPPFSLPPFVSACYSLLRSAAILDHAGRDNLSLTCIFCRCPFRLQWGKLCCADEHYIQTFLHVEALSCMHRPAHASTPSCHLTHAPHTMAPLPLQCLPCHAPPCILPPTPRHGLPCHAAAQMTDPRGISRYPTTFTDWSANDWHPSLYLGANMTDQVITTIKTARQFITYRSFWQDFKSNYSHVRAVPLYAYNQPLCTAASSVDSKLASPAPRPPVSGSPHQAVGNGHCVLGGEPRNCFLFARKFHPSTLPFLMRKSQQLLGF